MTLTVDSAVEEERVGDFPRFPRSFFLDILKKKKKGQKVTK